MARLPSSTARGRRTRSLIYIFAAVAIVVGMVVFVYRPGPPAGVEAGNPLDRNLNMPIEANAARLTANPTPAQPQPQTRDIEPTPVAETPAEPGEPDIQPAVVIPALPVVPVGGSADPKVSAMILRAADLANANRVVEARDVLNGALALTMTAQQRTYVRTQLSRISQEWLFSRSVLPEDRLCTAYRVQPGDHLTSIAARCKVPYELLMDINGIKRPELLKAGETIKVINGPFHVRIYRSTYTMDVYLQNTLVRTYNVGLGKPGHETPTGLWVVKNRMIKPRWTDPDTGRVYEPTDPDYPLGSRWIGLEGKKGAALGRDGFAIHGTNKPEEIGTNTSRGCIRLHNGDAVTVYNMLKEGLSQVEVMD